MFGFVIAGTSGVRWYSPKPSRTISFLFYAFKMLFFVGFIHCSCFSCWWWGIVFCSVWLVWGWLAIIIWPDVGAEVNVLFDGGVVAHQVTVVHLALQLLSAWGFYRIIFQISEQVSSQVLAHTPPSDNKSYCWVRVGRFLICLGGNFLTLALSFPKARCAHVFSSQFWSWWCLCSQRSTKKHNSTNIHNNVAQIWDSDFLSACFSTTGGGVYFEWVSYSEKHDMYASNVE